MCEAVFPKPIAAIELPPRRALRTTKRVAQRTQSSTRLTRCLRLLCALTFGVALANGCVLDRMRIDPGLDAAGEMGEGGAAGSAGATSGGGGATAGVAGDGGARAGVAGDGGAEAGAAPNGQFPGGNGPTAALGGAGADRKSVV